MTQGERVKAIRATLKLTLEKFGEKLGVGKTAISKIEKGERSLTVQMMKAICREYKVNYEYLKNGIGEMFVEVPQTVVDELCEQYDLDDFDRIMLQECSEDLHPEDLRADLRSRRHADEDRRRSRSVP